VTTTATDWDYEVFMERGTRWRELLPKGRYAWPLYDWVNWDPTDGEDGPPLIGHAVYWRRKRGLSLMLMRLNPNVTASLTAACRMDENGDPDYHLASFVAEPKKYAGEWGMHTGHCGFCGRALTDPKSREIGIGPECLRTKV
jgi:hypothetical protein